MLYAPVPVANSVTFEIGHLARQVGDDGRVTLSHNGFSRFVKVPGRLSCNGS
ncbi:hypothetical protein [Hymenobacter volaticus]|uniref:Uncharacterized protein n=1 Tax=Hymenobacter volaticus TaxID=2932254 RepID=A0ABY4GFF7_9BACT|nr:hypothetical protein [Hymenobacter volaticus]UOQ69069.1 hypothetical protein MUN86_26565 [Hymenobacter volaticus]